MVDRRVSTLARALGAATTRRGLFAAMLAVVASRSLTARVAAQATPTADAEPGWEAGVAGLASRTFAAPDPDAPGLVSLSAIALAYHAPEEAAAAFPFMFEVFCWTPTWSAWMLPRPRSATRRWPAPSAPTTRRSPPWDTGPARSAS